MRKLIPLMLMLCLTSSSGYCQRILLVGESSDTTICFTIPQSKFLLKAYYGREECNSLLHICEQEVDLLEEVGLLSDSIIYEQNRQLTICQLSSKLKDGNINLLQTELKLTKKEVSRQKTLKIAYFLGGGLVGIVMGFAVR